MSSKYFVSTTLLHIVSFPKVAFFLGHPVYIFMYYIHIGDKCGEAESEVDVHGGRGRR